MHAAGRFIAAGLLCVSALACQAQTVYKCESNGTASYSHEPCVAATVVDTTPTQGLDQSSGKSRKGADVRRSEQNKAMADALRPILRETPAQREKRQRRVALAPEDRLECANLDARLPVQETVLRGADAQSRGRAQAALFASRKRYRELRC